MTPAHDTVPVGRRVQWRAVGLALLLAAVFVALWVLRRGSADAPSASAPILPEGVLAEPSVPGVPSEVLYTVAYGDTLSSIALRHGTTTDQLMDLNGLADADAIAAGQQLRITQAPDLVGPDLRVVPDSEVIYGPSYRGFDVAGAVASAGGWLGTFRETVDGEELSGGEIVSRVAAEYSVGPRVLLAFLEAASGAVTGTPAPQLIDYPAGLVDPQRSGLWRQTSWLADALNAGFYDWRGRDTRLMVAGDGVAMAGHPSLGPGSYAVQVATARTLEAALLEDGLGRFQAAYRYLFGDPWAMERPLAQHSARSFPDLAGPWSHGVAWWFTGGAHGGWARGSAWAAVDFVPGEAGAGCGVLEDWALAVAPGVVIDGGPGLLWLDIDGDGARETGPVVLYMHLATFERRRGGSRVEAGDRLGHPSCEGGISNAAHLHLARLLDGEWLPVAGPPALRLDGWSFQAGDEEYDGEAVHDDGRRRSACECRELGENDITAE